MAYSKIVLTSGVSMFAGQNLFRKYTEEKSLLTFPTQSHNPKPPSNLSEKEALDRIKKHFSYPYVFNDISIDPERVSAEYSALHALNKEKRITGDPQIVLIHTDTFGGNAAVCILQPLLKRNFNANVECVKCSINVADRSQLRNDLGDFMGKVATAIRDHDKHTACFVPLGGYKIMTSLGYLVGAYFGFPTLYTHEDHQQIIHEVPAIPVHIPPKKIQELAPLMQATSKGIEFGKLSMEHRKLLDDNTWLFDRADGIVCLNAFGLFLMEEHPSIFNTEIYVSKEVDKEFKNDRRKSFVIQQLSTLSRKLKSGDKDVDLQHERAWGVEQAGGWHLYKGASNGELVFRAVYKYQPEKNLLCVAHIWTNHDYDYQGQFKGKWPPTVECNIEWQLET